MHSKDWSSTHYVENAACVFEIQPFMWQQMRDLSKAVMNAVVITKYTKGGVAKLAWTHDSHQRREGQTDGESETYTVQENFLFILHWSFRTPMKEKEKKKSLKPTWSRLHLHPNIRIIQKLKDNSPALSWNHNYNSFKLAVESARSFGTGSKSWTEPSASWKQAEQT